MTDRQAVAYYFIASDAGGDGDGSRERPFSSLLAALEELRDRATALSDPADGKAVAIVFVDGGSPTVSSADERAHQFFVDAFSSPGGDGSAAEPWNEFATAFAALAERARKRQLALSIGQRLDITRREVFTATALERGKKLKESIAKFVFLCMALICVVPVIAVLTFFIVKGWPALSLDFLLENPQQNLTAGGVWAPLIGTFFLVLTSLMVAAPIGILAGVYLNEYAGSNWFTRIVNLSVVNLAGVPSIVHALFGVGAFVHFAHLGKSLLAASCTVAVMTLPVIITSTREALAAVPTSFREACWNMGASRWQTIRTIVLPNSIAGILTGVILQVARAGGETAPILFTGAILYTHVADSGWASWAPYGPQDKFMALSYHLFALSTQIRGVSDELLYGTAVVLIGLVLLVNSASIGLRVYMRSRKKW
ncbi:MAG: phosphate ABC transporter permease PstA [Pirellulaceae bacterium]|jgi:phosphate transport system permease protein|nr:phosphate ABC transporter permease PstA [Pirellulaceae bacterium]MDP7014771.1 phosphate ABC transporter permease PstA [Pirellulaceae bacterium]